MLTPDILIKGQQKAPNGVDWASLIDDLNALGANIPVITSPKSIAAVVNQPVSYQITATNSATSFGAENLPAGLVINNSTGVVSGKPTTVGTVQSTITATNTNGSGGAIVTFNTAAAPPPKIKPPVITSPRSANAVVGKTFSYRITAANSPTSFGASGLPSGLTVNSTTGVISGVPKAAATIQITVSASNAGGKGTQPVQLTISKTPPRRHPNQHPRRRPNRRPRRPHQPPRRLHRRPRR